MEEKTANCDGDDLWWTTVDILAGRDEKKRKKDIQTELDEWLAGVRAKFEERYSKRERKRKPKGKRGKKDADVFGEVVEFECNFNNPTIRSRLELLMGSNVVRITDRKYMIKLQSRIREDHLENLRKRIQIREMDEVEREKKLILSGKVSLEEAPKELKNHPICRINELAKKILEEKKAKMKVVTKVDAYKTPMKRIREAEKAEKELELEDEEYETESDESTTIICVTDADVEEDIARGFMFNREDYDKLRYEAPLIKVLKEVESVDEMYNLADEIVGPIK